MRLHRHSFLKFKEKNNQEISLNQRNLSLPYSNAQICLIQRNFFLGVLYNFSRYYVTHDHMLLVLLVMHRIKSLKGTFTF